MKKLEKQAIAQELRSYCEQMGSQNKAANSIKDVSAATISQMLSGNWELISDAMWRAVAAAIGAQDASWVTVETQQFKRMTLLLESAQYNAQSLAITGAAGSGKTQAIRQYVRTHENAYHLSCAEYWNKKNFLQNLLRRMGCTNTYGTIYDLVETIVANLQRKDSPIIILDEADKLNDGVLYFFISLYNQLEGKCGIALVATDYLEKRIMNGIRYVRKGYNEIYSRIGRNFIGLQVVNEDDVRMVCEANGIADTFEIEKIYAECDNDLRRVARRIEAIKSKKHGKSVGK